MKNFIIWAATAAVVLSGCSNDFDEVSETTETRSRIPMSFTTYVPGMTRLYEATADSLEYNGFFLRANHYYQDADENYVDTTMFTAKMDIQYEGYGPYATSSWVSEDWTSSPVWPTVVTDTVKFYALYNPQMSTTNVFGEALVADDNGSVTWTPFPDSVGNVDYMAAYTCTTLGESNGEVTLNFKHILAQIQINVIGDATLSGYDYQIGGCRIEVPYSGTYNFEEQKFDSTSMSEANTTEVSLDDIGISSGRFIDEEAAQIDGVTISTQEASEICSMTVFPDTCTFSIGYIAAVEGNARNTDVQEGSIKFKPVAGCRNIINITLSPSAKAMSFSVAVVGWTEADTYYTNPE